jgi:hypothetical protein
MRHLALVLCVLLVTEACLAQVWVYSYSCKFKRERVFAPDGPAANWGGKERGSYQGFIVLSPSDETRVDYYWANKYGYRYNTTETLPTDWVRIRDDKGQDWVTINLDSRWNANPLPSAASQRQFTVMRMLQGKIVESVRLPAGATIYSVPKTLKGTHDVFLNHLGVTWESHPHDTLVAGGAWARESGKISAKLDGSLTLQALLAGGTFAAARDVIIAYQEDRGATSFDLVAWPYWRRVLDWP